MPNNALVLLIDEHDAPLMAHLGHKDEEEREALSVLKGIYGTVKAFPASFRCVFVTGILRYKDLGLGTAGNSMIDESLLSDFG